MICSVDKTHWQLDMSFGLQYMLCTGSCQNNTCPLCTPAAESTIQYHTTSNLYNAATNLSRSAKKNYEKVSVNTNDFKCRLKALVSVIVRRWGGREFHAAGPEQLKPRSLNLVLVMCLKQSVVSDDLRCLRLLVLTDCTQSTRYCGCCILLQQYKAEKQMLQISV